MLFYLHVHVIVCLLFFSFFYTVYRTWQNAWRNHRMEGNAGLLSLCLSDAPTSKTETILLPCMQGSFNYFWKVHSICRIMLHLASLALEVCSSKHRMNDTTYSILITARRQRGYRGMPFIMLDMRLGFYQTHFLWLYGEFEEHIFDAFSNLLDILIFIFCFRWASLPWKLPA